MLTGLQKAKALKELKQLRQDKASQNGLALAKTLKRMKELRTDLGMGTANTKQLTDTSTTEPVIALTGKEFGEFEDTPDGLKALREASIQYLDNLRETQENIFCSAVNADVLLDKTGIKKIKSFSSNRIKLKALFAIKDLIKNATLVKANQESYDNEEKKRGITYSIIKTPIVIDGVEYGTRMVLRKLPDGTYHYDLQIKDNVNVIFDSINDSQKNSDKGGSAKESDVLYRLAESYQNNSNHVKLMFDKATIDVNNMVLNLFIFDKDGNEIADDSTDTTIGSDTRDELTELAQLLTDLQEERILPNDIDLDHLAELAVNSDENDTLDQIRNILDMELVAKWLQQLDNMVA